MISIITKSTNKYDFILIMHFNFLIIRTDTFETQYQYHIIFIDSYDISKDWTVDFLLFSLKI